MSLRIRLEGSMEALERVESGCDMLAVQLEGGWRDRLEFPEQQQRARMLAEGLAAMPAALAKVAALRDRVTRKEQKELEGLVKHTVRAGRRLEQRVDKVLLASAAEMVTSLDRKLARVAELARRQTLEAGEHLLCDYDAKLRRVVEGRWMQSHARVPGEHLDEGGKLRLTQERLLYDDRARRIELPLRGLELRSLEAGVEMRSGSDVFEAMSPKLPDIALRLVLVWRFPPGAGGPVPHTIVKATRQRDQLAGWLLAWPGGVLFVPKKAGAELSAALGLADALTAPLDGHGYLEAIATVLPWAAEAVLTRMAQSTWNWSWRREEIVIRQEDGAFVLRHRSGDDYQPAYVVNAEVEALLTSGGRPWHVAPRA